MEDNPPGEYKIIICEGYTLIQHIDRKKLIMIENSPFKISNYFCHEFSSKFVVKEVIICNAILGIIVINEVYYIIYVKKARLIGKIKDNDIFEIKEVDFHTISYDVSNETNTLENLKQLLSKGFFYSYTYDLTTSLQKQSKTKSSVLLDKVDKNYFWNLGLYKEFIHKKIDQVFFAILIYGYVAINNYRLKETDEELSFIIISRKLVHNSNKLSYSTGLNDQGHASNYIETEQLMSFKNYQFSFVQSRGSCPIFYEIKQNFTGSDELAVKITKPFDKTKSAFIKHLKIMIREYNFIYFINCLNSKKENEGILLAKVEELLKINDISLICKYDNDEFEIDEDNLFTHQLDTFILAMEKVFQNFKFFCYCSEDNKVLSTQMGIVRTTCFDTNTKTNHIQKKIAKKAFENFINYLTYNTNARPFFMEKIVNSSLTLQDHPILQWFDNSWIENGKTIESIYGIKSKDRESKPLIRLRKDIYDIFLGNEKVLNELIVYVGTWNFAGRELREDYKIVDWLLPLKNTVTPDIYIIGLQEIVDLNTTNIVFVPNTSRVETWKKMIYSNLQTIDNYVILKSLDLVGIFLIVFVKDTIKHHIKNFNSVTIKTGFFGTLGNKGNVIMRWDFNDVSFAVSCCHLASDLGKNESRVKEMVGIMNKSIQVDKNHKEKRFKDHDVMMIFGDLNFRLEIDNSLCRQMIKNGNLTSLISYDQLLKVRDTNPTFSDLVEGPLTFNPTYKFNINSNEYDTSKKNRVPAWCDRIIWKKHHCIEQIFYDSVDYRYSDHKPVYAYFRVNTIESQKNIFNLNKVSQSCRNFENREKLNLNDDNSYVYSNVASIRDSMSQAGITEASISPEITPKKEFIKNDNNFNNYFQEKNEYTFEQRKDFNEEIYLELNKKSNSLILEESKEFLNEEINIKVRDESNDEDCKFRSSEINQTQSLQRLKETISIEEKKIEN